MQLYHAYHKKFDWLSSDARSRKYLHFLKSHFEEGKPHFYSVASSEPITTPHGDMYAIKIIEDLENPELEPIAECWLNGYYFYLWRASIWTIATDKTGKAVLRNYFTTSQWSEVNDCSHPATRGKKVLIIYKLGDQDVEICSP